MNNTNFIEQYGVIPIKKFRKNKWDPRDKKYSKLVTAPVPFDWQTGYDVEVELRKVLNDPDFKIPVKNQKQSSSCGGQALSYYRQVQEAFNTKQFIERSAKDVYSQIFYPQGGVMPRDVANIAVKKGVCREELIPSMLDGDCPEWFIRQRKQTPMTIGDALTAVGLRYAEVAKTPEAVAQAIRDNYGVIFVYGSRDNGTQLSVSPTPPPTRRDEEWAHFVYAGKAYLVNGKKKVGVINSWGPLVGKDGWQTFDLESWLPHISTIYAIYDPERPDIQEKVTLYTTLLTLAYKLLQKLTGYQSKKLLA